MRETFRQKQYIQAEPMPTGLQNGLIVAPRGTVYKAIEIKVE